MSLSSSAATFDFDVSDLLGKENLTSVELIDGVTQFEASISGDVVVPEPTTATLSLLALAGLAARRRRK